MNMLEQFHDYLIWDVDLRLVIAAPRDHSILFNCKETLIEFFGIKCGVLFLQTAYSSRRFTCHAFDDSLNSRPCAKRTCPCAMMTIPIPVAQASVYNSHLLMQPRSGIFASVSRARSQHFPASSR